MDKKSWQQCSPEVSRHIARLESLNDLLKTELCDIDRKLKIIGFTHGLVTVKSTVDEIIDKGWEI